MGSEQGHSPSFQRTFPELLAPYWDGVVTRTGVGLPS